MKSNAKESKPAAVMVAERPVAGVTLSIWVRIGLPAALAIMAGWMNATTIRQRLNPTEAFALAVEVVPGMRLQPEHFQAVQVGGSLDRSTLVSRLELETDNGRLAAGLSMAAALQQAPKMFTRFMRKGELLTDGSLSGREALAADERLIQVPFSKVRGNCSELQPGQVIYLDAIHGSTNGDKLRVESIGPFRVALTERKEQVKSNEPEYLGLVSKVGPQGQLSSHAELLRTAVYSESSIRLALIEGASPNRTAVKANKEVAANLKTKK